MLISSLDKNVFLRYNNNVKISTNNRICNEYLAHDCEGFDPPVMRCFSFSQKGGN